MPTITLNKKVLLKQIGKNLDDEKLKHYISYLGTDLDSIEKDEVIVEVFPNRPDFLSEQGFGRALATFTGSKKGLSKYEVKKSGEKVIVEDSVANVRPYTACAIVKGLKLSNDRIVEIINIQEKLTVTFGRNRKKVAIGIYPLENIKMPIHFRALPSGEIRFRPLEMSDELGAKSILEKHPKGREYGHLLDGLSKYPIFVDGEDRILSLPPVINSHNIGKVVSSTKDVFIECSGHELKPQIEALNMLVTTLADLGGKIYSMDVVYPDKKIVTPDLKPIVMKIDLEYVNKKLGLELKEKDLKLLFERMGYGYEKGKALIPAYRADIIHQIDLVEDVAIAYGYDKFEEEIPNVATIGKESSMGKFSSKVREFFVGNGLLETKNYTMSNERMQNQVMNTKIDLVKLENSLSEEYNVMRAWIIPCLLKTLNENKHHEYPQNLFEIGTVFKKSEKEDTGVKEDMRAAMLLCNDSADYTKAKQVLEALFEALGIEAKYEETKHPSFVPGRVARVKYKDKGIAYIGELHPEVFTELGIEMPMSCFELNLSELKELIS